MAKQITKILTALILAGTINVPIVYAVDYGISNPPPQYGTNDPGVQLNRTREYMERQRVARQIAEDRAKQRAEVEGEAAQDQQGQTPQAAAPAAGRPGAASPHERVDPVVRERTLGGGPPAVAIEVEGVARHARRWSRRRGRARSACCRPAAR